MKSTNSENPEEETPLAFPSLVDFFGEVFHVYTRSQAIEDGTLIPATEPLARAAGFAIPVAYTSGVYTDCIEWTAEDDDRSCWVPHQTGRELDVLNLAHFATQSAPNVSIASFEIVYVSRFPQNGTTVETITLLSEIGPDDHGDPCLTIMHPHEC
jgi:hypothetical protein